VATQAGRAAAGRWSGATRWLRHAWIAAVVAIVAVVVGDQVVKPNPRMLQVVAATILVAVAARLSSFTSLLFLVVMVPFPKSTSYGGTTLAFVLLIFILWLVRLALRVEKPAGRSPIDLPVVILVSAYLLSFSQIEEQRQIYPAITITAYTFTHIFLGYLIIHLTRTERQLRQLVTAIVVMAVLVQLTAVFELVFPTRPLIPGWIELRSQGNIEYTKAGLEIVNLRVGGSIGDYELLAEFTAMILLLLWFMLVRARTAGARIGVVALILLDVFVLLATVTRGALFSLAIAAPVIAWRARRHIRFHTFVISLALLLGGGWLVLDFVAHHTRSGNVLERMEKTTFVRGVPDNRTEVWADAWGRILKRPVFGYGPLYGEGKDEARHDVKQRFWPHNNYLMYWHMLGIVGLAAFLWILQRLWRATRHAASSMGDPDYARGLLLALQGMLVLFVIDQIKIDYLRNPVYAYWVWIFFGLIVAADRIAAQTPGPTGPGGPAPARPRSRRLPAVSAVSAV
jgi:O-antigen ligase